MLNTALRQKSRLISLQSQKNKDNQEGGFFFGNLSSGKEAKHINSWCTMFAMQAIKLYDTKNINEKRCIFFIGKIEKIDRKLKSRNSWKGESLIYIKTVIRLIERNKHFSKNIDGYYYIQIRILRKLSKSF